MGMVSIQERENDINEINGLLMKLIENLISFETRLTIFNRFKNSLVLMVTSSELESMLIVKSSDDTSVLFEFSLLLTCLLSGSSDTLSCFERLDFLVSFLVDFVLVFDEALAVFDFLHL